MTKAEYFVVLDIDLYMEDYMKYRILLSLLLYTASIFSIDNKSSAWFAYAQNDLRAAQVLTQFKDPLFGVALYHIEQAVEKALKAYLIFYQQKFALVHDLPPLLAACQKIDSGFSIFAADAKEISPYATKSRYPNNSFVMPEKTAVELLIDKAQHLIDFIRIRMI